MYVKIRKKPINYKNNYKLKPNENKLDVRLKFEKHLEYTVYNYLHDNKIGLEKQIIWFVYKHCFHFRNDQSPADKISWLEETWKVMY